MTFLRWVAVASLVCLGYAQTYTLTDENFDDLTATGDWILEFYAPWCGHCKKLNPVLEEVSKEVDNLNIGQIDATVQQLLAGRFQVRSYPTLYFKRDGSMRPYTGDRNKEDFLDFADLLSSPPISEITEKDLREALKQNDVSFLYVGPLEDSEDYEAYHTIARRFQGENVFYQTNNEEVAALAQVFEVGTSGVVVAVNIDETFARFKTAFDVDDLDDWITAHRLPLLPELTGQNFRDLTEAGVRTLIGCIDPETKKSERFLAMLRNIARMYEGDFKFCYVDAVRWSRWTENFGIRDADLPTVFAFDSPEQEYWTARPGQTLGSEYKVKQWIKALKNGDIPVQGRAWYNPGRIWRKFTKFMFANFTEAQMFLGAGASMVGVTLLMFYCAWRSFADDPEEVADAKYLAELKKAQKTESEGSLGKKKGNGSAKKKKKKESKKSR